MITAAGVGVLIVGIILLLVLVAIGVFIYFFIKWLKSYHNRIVEVENEIKDIKQRLGNLKQLSHSVKDKNNITFVDEDWTSVNNTENNNDVRPRSRGKPRYTFKIHKEKANCYGAEAHVSQLVSTAQKYFKDEIQSDKSVPFDQMDITSISSTDRNNFVSMKRKSVFEGRPTSVLLEPSGEQLHDKGMFCYKTIGSSGGVMEISGVTLKIPPGALEAPIRITLGILWDETLQPKLTKKQALLSPVVLCQPNLKFKQPVTLIFPHCAAEVSNWNLKILQKDGALGENSDWTAMDFNEHVQKSLTLSHVSLELRHFTLYTCIGEGASEKIAAKAIKLIAFTSKFEMGAMYKARIYCINDYGIEMKDVTETERQLKGKMADAPVPLFVHDNGENISVALSSLSENWNLAGKKIEEIDFEHVWHALTPSCTFIFKPSKPLAKEILCEFDSSQKSQDCKKAKLKIADHFEQTRRSLLNPIEDDPKEELIRSLAILLDPATTTEKTGDYRLLAEKVKCCFTEIRWLESQINPTEIVINKFITDGGKMNELYQILLGINRPDAAEIVKKYMQGSNAELRTRGDQLLYSIW